MSLRIAYIGAGSFTNQCMFPQLAKHGLDLAAVCDLDEGKAVAAQQRWGFQATYTDFREMLDKERPEAVFCVGGPQVHYEVGMEVLDRGFPLYVQKSPAPSSAAAREMSDLAAKRNVVCHVGFNLRSAPAVQRAKEILGTDEFGQPLMGIFRYGLAFGKTMRDVVMDQHCHLVDLAGFLMGEAGIEKVVSSRLPDARDYVVALRFESGAVGTLNCTSGQIVEKGFAYFEITGNGTFLCCRECADLMWHRSVDRSWWKHPVADEVVRHGAYGSQVMLGTLGYLADVSNFAAAVRGEEEDVSPVGSTVATMAMCEEIVRDIEGT